MTDSELIKILDDIHVAKFSLKSYLKKRFPAVYAEIISKTQFLTADESISLHERIYCIKHHLTAVPLCSVCNMKTVRFDTVNLCYKKWCSVSCSCKDPATLAKSRKTRLAVYGSETYNGAEKSKKTRKAKNNGKWHADDFCTKSRQTKLERYGDADYVNSQKARQTKLERYGDADYVNAEQIRQTKLERYSDEHYSNREQFKTTIQAFSEERQQQIKTQRKSTNLARYGHESAMQNDTVKKKAQHTCSKRYGVTSTLRLKHVRQSCMQKIKEQSWDNYISKDTEYVPLFTREEYISNTDPEHEWRWKHISCGTEFKSVYDDGHHHRCYKCWPNTSCGTSLLEQEVRDYVKSLLPDAEVFNKTAENRHIIPHRELDIYVPSKKFAIEFDGLYYHSEHSGKDRLYHLSKTEECEKRGIRLIHIFEDEWIEKKELVKTKLRHLLTDSCTRIFARKCQIKMINNQTKDVFLEKNHIQGKDISNIRYGLFYNAKLAAVMTFIKSRFNKNYQWELSRYATDGDVVVVGGASRLLKHFERDQQPTSLITYADRRWSQGKTYSLLGFKLLHISAPNYWYVKNGHRYSRIMFQKHKLAQLLPVFNPELTEVQNMNNNGYDRIFDCGNSAYIKLY